VYERKVRALLEVESVSVAIHAGDTIQLFN